MLNQFTFEGVVSYPKLTDKFISFSLSQPYNNRRTGETTWTRVRCMLSAEQFSFIEDKMRLVVIGRVTQNEYNGKSYWTLWGDKCAVSQKNQPNGTGQDNPNIPFPAVGGGAQSKSSKPDVAPVKNDAVIGDEPIPF